MKLSITADHPRELVTLDKRRTSLDIFHEGRRIDVCLDGPQDSVVDIDMSEDEAAEFAWFIIESIEEKEKAREQRRNREKPRSKWVDTKTMKLL